MKKLFQKAVTVLGSVALVGASMGGAMAATYPAPFDAGNYAVVYGSSNDMSAATTIANSLNADDSTTTTTEFSFSETLSDDEVELNTVITAGSNADITATIQDNKLSGLKDEKFSWDDGNGADEYDFHEEIRIGTMIPVTSMNGTANEGLDDGVVLTNEQGLRYRMVFEDALNVSGVGDDDADDLYLDILGKSYEITGATVSTITVVTSEEYAVGKGDSVTVDGKTFTVEDVSSTAVRVNGETISSGSSKKIDGLRVKVKTGSVFYNENFPEDASLTLQIGTDISKTFTDGEEYIGQDETSPLWRWEISSLDSANGYIGVYYDGDIDDFDDEAAAVNDMAKGIGEAYVFPENYAAVSLDGLTDVNYEDLKFSFEASEDLFPASDSSTATVEDVPVLVITGDQTDTLTIAGNETNMAYVYYNYTADAVELYYYDHNNDYTPSGKMRKAGASLTVDEADESMVIGTVQVGDTDLRITLNMTGADDATGGVSLLVYNLDNSADEVLNLSLGGTDVNYTGNTGTFEYLGAVDDDADTGDMEFQESDKSTKEYNFMDEYGIKVSAGTTVKSEVDSDEITLSIPDERVYAMVTVGLGPEVSSSGSETGNMVFMDSATSSYADKNIVVVGGSCVNAVAATLLGSNYCGDAFTGATDVKPGEFLIETFNYNGKVATLVAGYEKADTAKAAAYLANVGNAVSTDVNAKYIGQTTVGSALKVA